MYSKRVSGKGTAAEPAENSAPVLFHIWNIGHPGHVGGNSSLVQEKPSCPRRRIRAGKPAENGIQALT